MARKKGDHAALPMEVRDAAHAVEVVRHLMGEMDRDPSLREAIVFTKVGNPITVEVVPDAARWAEKQINRSVAAGQEWVDGIQRPSADFKAAAIAAAGKHKQRTQEALNEDRYRKGMAKVDVNEAIDTAVRVGAAGYASGVQARENKIRRVVADLQPRVAAVKRAVQAMPQDTDAQREQRLLAALRGMKEVGKARRG